VGVREWVGLLFLGVGIVVAASFYFPDSGRSAEPRPRSGGQVTTRTRTAVPEGAPIQQPTSWTVSITSGRNNLPLSASTEQRLDVAYDSRPLEELQDEWGVAAEAQAQVSAGRHTLRLRHTGSIRVYIDGELTADATARSGDDLSVNFIQQVDGIATIRIEVKAVDDEVALSWR